MDQTRLYLIASTLKFLKYTDKDEVLVRIYRHKRCFAEEYFIDKLVDLLLRGAAKNVGGLDISMLTTTKPILRITSTKVRTLSAMRCHLGDHSVEDPLGSTRYVIQIREGLEEREAWGGICITLKTIIRDIIVRITRGGAGGFSSCASPHRPFLQ